LCRSFAEREHLLERRQVDGNQSEVYQPYTPDFQLPDELLSLIGVPTGESAFAIICLAASAGTLFDLIGLIT
jgi:hypothetical protein